MVVRIEAPGGDVIEFPDGTSDDVILRVMRQNYPPQQQPEGRSIAGNLIGAAGRGVSNFLGLPGDIASGIDRGSRWLFEQATGVPAPPIAPPEGMPNIRPPTSMDVRSGMQAAGIPVDQRAVTPTGRIAQDVVEGALSLPVGPAALGYGAVAGAGSGAAGEGAAALGMGEGWQQAARIAGGLAAPLAVSSGVRAVQAAGQPRPPTTEQLHNQANAAYRTAEQAGVVVSGNRVTDLVNRIERDALRLGIDPTLHPGATAALRRLTEVRGQNLSLAEIDTLRQVLASAAGSRVPGEAMRASRMIDMLDDFVARMTPRDLVAGNAQQGVESLRQARDLWSRMRKSELIETAIERAGTRAGQFSGSGFENALRTEFRQLAMNPRRLRGFTDAERDAVRRVATGGPIENVLRLVGKLAPTGVVSGGVGAGLGYTIGGPVGAVAVPAAGAAARYGATALTAANAQRAGAMVRGGLPPLPLRPDQASLAAALLALRREAESGRALPPGAGP